MKALPRIRPGLLKHPLDKQVLVYDTVLDRVHLLDPTTACVLELLEEDSHTEDEISAQIVARLDLAPNAGFLPLAIEELRRADLLDLSDDCGTPMVDVDRRELLKRVAMTGAAALLIPTVASLTATRGYAQATAANHGLCNTCTSNANCTTGVCCAGICLPSCTGGAGGQCCNAGTQCASGNCASGFCTGATGAGGTCTLNNQCVSNNCCNGICTSVGGTCPQANGAICNANGQCSTNNCCNGVCSPVGSLGLCVACTSTCQCASPRTCVNGSCGGAVAHAPNGAVCTGQDNGACANGNAKVAANATCCSNNCVGTCTRNGSDPSIFTGTCQP